MFFFGGGGGGGGMKKRKDNNILQVRLVINPLAQLIKAPVEQMIHCTGKHVNSMKYLFNTTTSNPMQYEVSL